jgi:flagellar assembly protein FliH
MGILRSGTSTRVELFEYPASTTPPPTHWEDIPEVGTAAPPSQAADCIDEDTNPDTKSCELSPASVAEGTMHSFEAGREQGIREARETAANEQLALLQDADKTRMEQAAHLAGQVKTDRERFLHEVEHELVQLALAIAARILRREAQMDPLFLIGAVRVALGQLAATMQVRLRVPAAESGLWTETLAHIPNLKMKPAVIPDDSMQLGDCLIETEMGSVDLGLRAQLHQIELALLDGAPATKADTSADPRPPEHEIRA